MSTRLQRIAAHLQSSPASLAASRTASSAAPRSVQLVYSPEVRKALNEKRGVVALESTIISHGMPYPQNLETAVQVEDVVRQNGGTPATIAILGGVIHIGLTHNQLEQLAKLGHKCKKVSRRDLAIVLAEKSNGATTVAATMYLAYLAGIRVFVTGGIGGVHRGVEATMDVSADLTELGRTPVAVVSAGVKSILDIPKTLEFLETQGVTVMTVGAKEFPAFFTPHSGCESPHSVANAHEAAKIVASNAQLGLESGMVIAVPVPESEAANAEPVQRAISEALAEAHSKNILGREVTPFLLKRVNELTKGDSLRSNIALVKNNAKVGTQIAVAANAILHSSSPKASSLSSSAASAQISPIVVGGTNLDLYGRPSKGQRLLMDTSNPGTITRQWGGVGRNIAEALGRLEAAPLFISVVGEDVNGDGMIRHSNEHGIRTDGLIRTADHPTSTYMAIFFETGDLCTTIADMEACTLLTPAKLASHIHAEWWSKCPLLVIDANLPHDTITVLCESAAAHKVPVWYEPTSVAKAGCCVEGLRKGQIAYLSPSLNELFAIAEALGHKLPQKFDKNDETVIIPCMETLLTAHKRSPSDPTPSPLHIVLKMGPEGVMLGTDSRLPTVPPVHVRWHKTAKKPAHVAVLEKANTPLVGRYRCYAAIPITRLENTSGAGDTLVGTTVWALCCQAPQQHPLLPVRLDFDSAVMYGMHGSKLTVEHQLPISPLISVSKIKSLSSVFH